MPPTYRNDSEHKRIIRAKWVNYIKEIAPNEENLSILTFPSEEMQDLALFVEEGLINWEKTETSAFRITKGKIICFEKSQRIFAKINQNLAGAITFNQEIGAFLLQNYNKISVGGRESDLFPLNAVNLDFDDNLSKNPTPIWDICDMLFKFQSQHEKDFCLFITLPETETEDEVSFKHKLKQIISSNLLDVQNTAFIEQFNAKYVSLQNISYGNLVILGLAKIIAKHASHNNYQIHKNEFYSYGENGRHKMLSLLFCFKHVGGTAGPSLYLTDVIKTLNSVEIIN
jgi:hypothetical protein